ncbi:hypothetical protein ACFFJ7_03250 [Pseudochelatococcus lubricantis]|uniref:hypothetical protein n=1 Tax=Pseudochelatococcus lubricantis TaxID=1538102 RepID=UPI0035EB0A31
MSAITASASTSAERIATLAPDTIPARERSLAGDETARSGFPVPGEDYSRPSVDFAIAARIAAAIARPLGATRVAVGDFTGSGPISVAGMSVIARHASFGAALNRAAARLSKLEEIAIDTGHLRQLGRSSASSLSLTLATDDPAVVAQASLLVGAAILHRHFLSCTLKSEREALRGILGNDFYLVATREAPVLYAPLAGLAGGSLSIDASIATDDERARDIGRRITATGHATLCLLVERTEPFLAPLFAIRNPPPPDGGNGAGVVAPLTDQHCAHIVKLLQRRFPPWSPIVG